MPEAGFFAQKQHRPGGLALVILLHAAVIAGVVLIKGPQFFRPHDGPLEVLSIPITPPPPPDQPPPPPHNPTPTQEIVDHFQPLTPQPQPDTPQPDTSQPATQLASNEGTGTIAFTPVQPPRPEPVPVRHAAQIDPSAQLQPPYPPSEQRMGREGRVQVRVTIGPDGRVTAISRLSATSDAFWDATQRYALAHWRFRPATVDGRPVEDSKVMSLTFRLLDEG